MWRLGEQIWTKVSEFSRSEMPVGHPGSAAGHTALGFRDSQAWMQEMGLHLRKLGGTYVGLGAPGVEVGREEPGKEPPTEERGEERRRGHQRLPRDPDSCQQHPRSPSEGC